MSEAEETELCMSCGLCCDGTMFNHVTVDKEELARIRLPMLHEDGEKIAFAQPCPHHAKGSCGVYEVRPSACVRFACALLKQLREGKEAAPLLSKARRTRVLAQTLWERLPAELRKGGLWTLLGSVPGTEHPRNVEPELLMDLVELAARLRRDFEAPALMSEPESITPEPEKPIPS